MSIGSDRLPTELLGRIVDEAAVLNHSRVQACALVSSSLLPHARKHIFRKISLSSSDRCEQLQDILNKNPAIAPFITSIYAGITGEAFFASNKPLFACLQQCTQLQALELMFDEDVTGVEDPASWNIKLPSLHVLELSGGPIPCSAVEALLSSCTSLDSLCFISTGFRCDAELPKLSRPPVRRLYISSCAGSDDGAGSRIATHIESIHALEVGLDYEGDAQFTGEVLDVCADSFNKLILAFQWDLASDAYKILSKNVKLSRCTNLRQLSLLWVDTPEDIEKDWLSLLLHDVGSHLLENVQLGLVADAQPEHWVNHSFHWSKIDESLSQKQQPALKEVKLQVFDSNKDAYFEKVQHKLTGLHSRGLLYQG